MSVDAHVPGFLRIWSEPVAMRVHEHNCCREVEQELMQPSPGAAGTQTVTGGGGHLYLLQELTPWFGSALDWKAMDYIWFIIHAFTHSFNKYRWSPCTISGIMPEAGDRCEQHRPCPQQDTVPSVIVPTSKHSMGDTGITQITTWPGDITSRCIVSKEVIPKLRWQT